MFLSSDLRWGYWIGPVAMVLPCMRFIFSRRIFCRCVSGIVAGWPRAISCRVSTTRPCTLFHFFEKLCYNELVFKFHIVENSFSLSFIYIYLYISFIDILLPSKHFVKQSVRMTWLEERVLSMVQTSTVVFERIHDVIKWKYFPHYWPFMRGIHQSPVNSPHKGQWRGALVFSLICAWINGWVNNREAAPIWDAITPIMTSL